MTCFTDLLGTKHPGKFPPAHCRDASLGRGQGTCRIDSCLQGFGDPVSPSADPETRLVVRNVSPSMVVCGQAVNCFKPFQMRTIGRNRKSLKDLGSKMFWRKRRQCLLCGVLLWGCANSPRRVCTFPSLLYVKPGGPEHSAFPAPTCPHLYSDKDSHRLVCSERDHALREAGHTGGACLVGEREAGHVTGKGLSLRHCYPRGVSQVPSSCSAVPC